MPLITKSSGRKLIYPDFSSLAVDGRNAFNSADRQKFLNKLYEKCPELSLFIEVWYLGRVELWFFFEDGSVGVIVSSEGCQQRETQSLNLFLIIGVRLWLFMMI